MNSDLFLPQIVKSRDFIHLGLPDNYFLIDLKEDKLYLNGQRFMTTKKPLHKYAYMDFVKERNLEVMKTPIWKKSWSWFVCQLDLGFDGRLFWKFFTKSNYEKFRGKPYFVCSYWHDRKAKLRKWFEQNLHSPCFVFPHSKKVLQAKLTAFVKREKVIL